MRAIEADGQIVGFVMLALTTPNHPEPYLWRLLIDRMHQRRGIGSRALELLADECRAMGDSTLLVSWAEGKGSPRAVLPRPRVRAHRPDRRRRDGGAPAAG